MPRRIAAQAPPSSQGRGPGVRSAVYNAAISDVHERREADRGCSVLSPQSSVLGTLFSRSIRGRRVRARSSSTTTGRSSRRGSGSFRRSSRSRAGWSTTRRRSGRRSAASRRKSSTAAKCHGGGDRGHRHHEPARDDRRLGSRDGPADRQRHRLAGPAHGGLLRRTEGERAGKSASAPRRAS